MGLEYSGHRSPPNGFIPSLSCPVACSLAQPKASMGHLPSLIFPELIHNRGYQYKGRIRKALKLKLEPPRGSEQNQGVGETLEKPQAGSPRTSFHFRRKGEPFPTIKRHSGQGGQAFNPR